MSLCLSAPTIKTLRRLCRPCTPTPACESWHATAAASRPAGHARLRSTPAYDLAERGRPSGKPSQAKASLPPARLPTHGSSRPRILCHCPHSVPWWQWQTLSRPVDAMRRDSRTNMDTSAHTHCPVRSSPLPSISLACPVLCRQRPSCTLPVLCLPVGLINFASRLSFQCVWRPQSHS